MNKDEPATSNRGRIKSGTDDKRQDWGYTDQYRRMMQRDNRKRKELEKGEEVN